jgi:methyl-accepting chemotaxis protein
MKNSSIVSRVYLGFIILIAILLGTAWLSVSGNQQVTSRMESITLEATPLMVNSSELTISFLNINRSLTPYFSAMYVDELDPFVEVIEANITDFHTQLEWLKSNDPQNELLSGLITEIETSSEVVIVKIREVLDLYIQYLDAKDQDLYMQAKFQSLASQLNSGLLSSLSKVSDSADKKVIETVLSQVSVLNSESAEAFSLLDMIEVRSVARTFKSRLERYEDAVKEYEAELPDLYKKSAQPLKLYSAQLFTPQGVIAQHTQAVEIYEKLREQRSALEFDIDNVLLNIEVLSEHAASSTNTLYEESSSLAAQTRNTLITFAVISVFIALFIGISTARMIKKPTRLLGSSLERVANKDLTSKVDYHSTNEFGSVADKVNLVIEHLSHMIEQMRLSATSLNQASLENQDTSNALNQAMSEQTSQTILVATALEQIESSVNEISNSANDSLEIVTKAVDGSQSGQEMMQQNIDLIEQLSNRLEESTRTIHTLEQESATIESILDVISGISEQTNLLALNAAIEAARAGEQGRGFSVVADEVRVLAARTTASTLEIQEKIDQLQGSAKLAVSQITQCVEGMESCVYQTNDVNGALEDVHNLLHKIKDSSYHIASATTEHQSVTKEVAKNVGEIHSLAEENQTRSEQLAEHSMRLEEMAVNQSALTESFKLSS